MLRALLVLGVAASVAGQSCGGGPHEYCCPDAKHCLTATDRTCRESSHCGADEVT